jgi:hypothetical protein
MAGLIAEACWGVGECLPALAARKGDEPSEIRRYSIKWCGLQAKELVVEIPREHWGRAATSGLGQSRHFGCRPTTSGLPLETDIVGAGRHVSNVPEPEVVNRPRTPSTAADGSR